MKGINVLAAFSRRVGWMLLPVLLAGCASTSTRQETQATVDQAAATLANFRNDPDMGWFRANVGRARAVLVSPNIFAAGFIVGGSSGRAVALARDASGAMWAGPAFYQISTGSLGLQAGAQVSEMVALVMTEKAVNSLLSSSFKMGVDVSVAAGPVGAGSGTNLNADIIVLVRSKGLYGGLNLDGTAITVSEKSNHAYYGRAVTPVDILVKRNASNPGAAPLLNSIAEAARK